MRKAYTLLFFLLINCVSAQYVNVLTVDAVLLDEKTKKPVQFANIGFVEKGIGTVSDEEGKFTLSYDEDALSKLDVLQISAIGYKTIKTNTDQLVRLLTNSRTIYMKPEPLQLKEVVLNSEAAKEVSMGSVKNDGTGIGYWKEKDALGGEIATVFRIKRKSNTRLKTLKINVLDNASDSLKIRVNVYDYQWGYPQYKINKQNIYHTVSLKEGVMEVDLTPYDIIVNDDCVVGIELIKVFGDTIEFALSGSDTGGISFKRYVSQDAWFRTNNIGMSFALDALVPEKKDKNKPELRKVPERISMYYDVSMKTANRDQAEELNLLKAYLKTVGSGTIEVIPFSNSIVERKEFDIDKGRNKDIYEYIQSLQNFGAANYSSIIKSNEFKADAVLVFSNGVSMFEPLAGRVDVPVFTINSFDEANHYLLQQVADYTDGHYINLPNTIVKDAVEAMTSRVKDQRVFGYKGKTRNVLRGKIFTASGPIQGASISIKDTFTETQSDIDGFFEIAAEVDDILEAKFLGMKTREVRVTNPNNVAILLQPDGQLLDEVLLRAEAKEEQVESAYGKTDTKRLGYATAQITSKDIGSQYTDLAQLIAGKFAGVSVVGLNVGYQTPQFVIRGGGGSLTTAYAMLDIDGIIYDSSQSLPYIDPQNIESITILKSVVATNKYGNIARGGAIVVRTKSQSTLEAELEAQNPLVRGNDYTEEVLFLQKSEVEIPEYLKELRSTTSFTEARSTYFELQNEASNQSIPFYIDCADYFKKWDKEFALNILTSIGEMAGDNPKALKALAFQLEALEKNIEAQYVYERLAQIRPDHEQSYRDLARIYVINEQYENAINLYKRILARAINDIEFIGLQRTIESELMHLLAFHREKVDYSAIPNDLRTAQFKYDLRIVFDWSDPNSEFEIQFVNPNKKFFIWSHTYFASKDKLLDEVKYGYNTEEFIIDDAESGEWMINIESTGNEDPKNPTYLKYTVFKNYGLANETREVKVIKLYEQKTKVTLDKFIYE